ncbi:hypothetical protein [Candidatus Carsonella ruddii]|uniref:hypothetical protein n=1 Tax=Carsonella ruddii TaxID=114186 RepID=UPI002478ECE5|nr:hypothetical protein [Candidatus Carsonella ruddii]WGS66693.1 hypothetical protein MEJ66_00130 [Candidatus Carsonella ruddii]
MKNIFLLKKISTFFSFGKDSIYSYLNCFYKKKKTFFLNYNNYKIKNIKLLKIYNFYIFFLSILKKNNNELIMRKIRLSCIKNNKNTFFIKNHHILDKIELIIFNLFKKKKNKNKNNWCFKIYFFIKPYYNNFIKKYFNFLDKSNKNIINKRNFIRCFLSYLN